jgi:hypothetical protein
MESAFSETRRAAELLQQFGGFPFTVTVIVVSPPFEKIFLATHHTVVSRIMRKLVCRSLD